MVVQYLQRAVFWETPESVQDANGNITTGDPVLTFDTVCRFEVNTKNQYKEGADGKKIVYLGIVYMPLDIAAPIKPGANIKVYDGVNKLIDDTVKQFSRGQFNMRIWV